jgi:hypothetical protein
MDEKSKKQAQTVRKTPEKKGEVEVSRPAKNAASTGNPSIAAVLLARSRRRITYS